MRYPTSASTYCGEVILSTRLGVFRIASILEAIFLCAILFEVIRKLIHLFSFILDFSAAAVKKMAILTQRTQRSAIPNISGPRCFAVVKACTKPV
jgi:hypothetical protein